MVINGIEVKIIRKDIKNVHLYVKPPFGKVELTCPLNFTDTNARFFIQTKLGWIKNKKAEFEEHSRQTKREFVSGESIYIWGIQYFLTVKTSLKTYDIRIDGNNVVFTVRKGSTPEQRESVFNEWFRERLKNEINKQLPKWEMKTGLKASSYTIKKMKSRWGTCNHDKKLLVFNLLLAQKDKTCLDYVILHELAHTKEKTHNNRFIKILDTYMPNWRVIKKTLNDSISAPWEE